jgi:hypothetical protein
LRTQNRAPNSAVMKLLEINKLNISEIMTKIKAILIQALYLLDDENFEKHNLTNLR